MAGMGTGYPNWFICPVARRNPVWMPGGGLRVSTTGHKTQVRTGRTKRAPSPGKGHPRKLPQSHEYRCQCGHVGWTCHKDILQKPLARDAILR